MASSTHSPAESWYQERESAWLYRAVAEHETDPTRRRLFLSLAQAAETQAGIWAQQTTVDEFRPRVRARLTAMLVRWFGVRALHTALVALKLRGLSAYQPASPTGHAMPTSIGDVGRRHRALSSGNNLRAAVFGINDGLISNASLIVGVAGAGVGSSVMLASGVAGLLAGALSMAAGEFVSVRSQREMYQHQIGLERAELAEYPNEEAEELALIYQARGLGQQQARALAQALIANPEQALNTLAREELGLNPDDLASPWGAALFSFCAFTVGAALPLIPLLLGLAGEMLLPAVLAIMLVGLFAVGALMSLFSGRNALFSGARMLAIGAAAAACTWLAGRLFDVGVA